MQQRVWWGVEKLPTKPPEWPGFHLGPETLGVVPGVLSRPSEPGFPCSAQAVTFRLGNSSVNSDDPREGTL